MFTLEAGNIFFREHATVLYHIHRMRLKDIRMNPHVCQFRTGNGPNISLEFQNILVTGDGLAYIISVMYSPLSVFFPRVDPPK